MSRRHGRNLAARRTRRRWLFAGVIAAAGAVAIFLLMSTEPDPPTIEDLGFRPAKQMQSALSMYMAEFGNDIESHRIDANQTGFEQLAQRYDTIRKGLATKGIALNPIDHTPDKVIDSIDNTVTPVMARDGWWWMITTYVQGSEEYVVSAFAPISARKHGELTTTFGKKAAYDVVLVAGKDRFGSNGYTTGSTVALFPESIRNDRYVTEVVRGSQQFEPLVDEYIKRQWHDSARLEDQVFADMIRYVEQHELQHIRDRELLEDGPSTIHPRAIRDQITQLAEARGYLAAVAKSGVEYGAYAQIAIGALAPEMSQSTAGAALAKRMLGSTEWTKDGLRARAEVLLAKTDPAVREILAHRGEPNSYQYGAKIVEAAMN